MILRPVKINPWRLFNHDMGRRRFLRAVGLAITAGITGCTALQDRPEPVETDYQPDARDSLSIAVGQLNTVALEVAAFQRGNPREATFDAAGPRARLERARNAIHAAETSASDDRVTGDVAAVRSYADAMAGTVTAVDSLVAASDRLTTARETIRDHPVDTDAAATLEAARTASSTAVEAHDTAATALETADGDRLRELDAQYEGMRDGLATLAGYVTGVDGLAVGYDRQVAGVDALRTAESRIDDAQFDGTRQSFTTAREAFTASATAFMDAVERAAEAVVPDLTDGGARSRALADLAAGYVALLDGRDRVVAAETTLADGDDSGARTALVDASDRAATALTRFEDGAATFPDDATAEFETARARARTLDALATGYGKLLDAHAGIETAAARIESDEFDAAREGLRGASEDAAAANKTFATGREAAGAVFAPEFETASTRVSATGSLVDGYLQLLDARDQLTAGETAFREGNYDEATAAFERAGETSRAAETTFGAGAQADADDLFTGAFDRALRRARALATLNDGYVTLLTGRQQIASGRDYLQTRQFEAASDRFEAADEMLATAEQTFTEGHDAAESVSATEFDRARCRVTHLRTAVDRFVDASEAGRNGDRGTATRRRDAGMEALERVNDC